MISLKAVSLVYFALLLGLAHVVSTASADDNNENSDGGNEGSGTKTGSEEGHNQTIIPLIDNTTSLTSPSSSSAAAAEAAVVVVVASPSLPSSSSSKATTQPPACPTTTIKPSENQCIFSLPSGDKLHLIVAVLIVGCLVLLMTTLMCACQVCHLKGLISGLHSRHDNIDLRAVREKSETPQKNKQQADWHPTEACLLLSEVTTGQEQSKELEVKIEEVKVEGMEQIGTETPVVDPNGDVNQENSIVPMEKQPESSDKPEV